MASTGWGDRVMRALGRAWLPLALLIGLVTIGAWSALRWLAAAEPVATPVVATATPTGPPFGGQPVSVAFRDSCSSCHGVDREGGAIGPALLPSRLTNSDDHYFQIIKEGKPGTAMPAWGAAGLSDEEIRQLVAYIKSPPAIEATQPEPAEVATGGPSGERPPSTTADRIILPAGFTATLLARLPEGKQPTVAAYGPDRALYVAVLAGEIYRLTEDGRLSVFAGPFLFPLGLAWRGDELYLSVLQPKGQRTPAPTSQCQPDDQRGQILVLRDTNADGRADQTRVLLPDLPIGLSARHLVNNLAFGPDDKLYVANGSCENRRQTTDDPRRGSIQRYNPDGTIPADNPDPQSPVIATGLRNPFGLAIHPADGTVFTTDNGRDDLGDDLPPDELNHIRFAAGLPPRRYGWPECFGVAGGRDCDGTEPPVAELEPHASANGMAFYTGAQFGPDYQHNLFIAYYGAGNPNRRPYGRKVARVELTRSGESYRARVTDFAVGLDRPLGILNAQNGGLIIADFGPIGGTGSLFRIDRVAGASPFARVTPPSGGAGLTYVAETGHTLAADFQRAWQSRGGLELFGHPISQEFIEDGKVVQYFERGRLERAITERCPDRRPPLSAEQCQDFRVRLGLLGRALAAGREAEPPFRRIEPFPETPDRRYFAETGHSLAAGFKRYWEAHGGLGTFGYPISEEFSERNPETGRAYTVQYFERARLEYHPELAGTPGEIQLGRLGAQLASQRYR